MNPPKNIDTFLLCCFVALITWQPFVFHQEIIMMETGIHLPALNALFHGAMPYRDFFYLRGPLELYVPAVMMLLFGKNMIMLPIFYYAGTILTLWVCIAVGQQIYRTRFVFYLAIPVLVARTFPRISYYYWGGLRYAIGFLSVLCVILYFKKNKIWWMFLAGVVSAGSFLTTAEAGACSVFAVASAFIFSYIFRLQERGRLLKAAGFYFLGIFVIIFPAALYFYLAGAIGPFFDNMTGVIFDLNRVFPGEPGAYPDTLPRLLSAFFPNSPYFKFMTPIYFYLFFALYIGWRIKAKKMTVDLASLICIAAYGLILYAAAFRKIEGHHFEMALQPEKLLLFFMAEEAFLFLRGQQKKSKERVGPHVLSTEQWKSVVKTYAIYFLFLVFIGTSIGFSIARYNNRFPAFQMIANVFSGKKKDFSPLASQETERLHLACANGLTVPAWQAEEFKGVTEFLIKNTASDEAVFAFPEVGNFNFLADRPFIGKFPIATFSWMKEKWEQELYQQLLEAKPRYIVMTKVGHRTFPSTWYFRYEKNKERFARITGFILSNYRIVKTFSSVEVYQLKEKGALLK